MLNGQLVSAHQTTSRKNQAVLVTQAQVNKVTGKSGGGGVPTPTQTPRQPGAPTNMPNTAQTVRPAIGNGNGAGSNNPVSGGGKVSGSTGSKVSAAEAQAAVNFHNKARRELKNPPVKWSNKIARYAQSRADAMARSRRVAHLPPGQNPYGENLAEGKSTGGSSQYTAKWASEYWFEEKKLMPRGARTMTANLFNQGVGHYTQMVWKGSTEIGMGVATFQQNGWTHTVIVCCYNPPGNMMTQPIY